MRMKFLKVVNTWLNDGTYYLMSLICILDGDYALAHQYMKKANEEDKDMPLHIMMEGVIFIGSCFRQI